MGCEGVLYFTGSGLNFLSAAFVLQHSNNPDCRMDLKFCMIFTEKNEDEYTFALELHQATRGPDPTQQGSVNSTGKQNTFCISRSTQIPRLPAFLRKNLCPYDSIWTPEIKVWFLK